MFRAFQAAILVSAALSAAAQALVRVPPNAEPVARGVLSSGGAQVSTKGAVPGVLAAFVAEDLVFALDKASIRVWTLENENAEVPGARLFGSTAGDSAASLPSFGSLKAMALHPARNEVAVLDASTIQPTVRVYSFEVSASDASAPSVSWTLEASHTSPLLATGTALAWSPDGATLAVAFDELAFDPTAVPRGNRYFPRVMPLSVTGATLSAGADVALPLGSSKSPGRVKDIAFAQGGAFLVVDAPGGVSSGALWRFPSLEAVASGPDAKCSNTGVPWGAVESLFPAEFLVSQGGYLNGGVAAAEAAAAPDVHSSLSFTGAGAVALSGPSSVAVLTPDGAPGPVFAVADTSNDRVVFYSDALFEPVVLKADAGSTETSWNSLDDPCGVWAAPGASTLVVADTSNGRVRVFDIDVSSLVPDESVALSFASLSGLSPAASAANEALYGTASVISEDGYPDGSGTVTGCVRAVTLSVAPSMSDREVSVSLAAIDPASSPQALLFAGDALSEGAPVSAADGAASVTVAIPSGSPSGQVFLLPLDGPSTNGLSVASASGGDPLGEDFGFVVTNLPPVIVDAACVTATLDGNSAPGAAVAFSAEFTDVSSDVGSLSYEWTATDSTSSVQTSSGPQVSFSFTPVGDATADLVVSDAEGASATKHYLLWIIEPDPPSNN